MNARYFLISSLYPKDDFHPVAYVIHHLKVPLLHFAPNPELVDLIKTLFLEKLAENIFNFCFWIPASTSNEYELDSPIIWDAKNTNIRSLNSA